MHQCTVCPKSFPSPSKLQRHYVIHTGKKPFTCKTCGKAFTQSEHLKKHRQTVHHSKLPTDRLPHGILTRSQQPNYDKPAAWINTRVSGDCTAASQQEKEIVTHKICLPSPETGNPPENMPHVNDVSKTLNSITNVMVMDLIPQEQVDSAIVDTSVCNGQHGHTCNICFKSFTSSLRLRIHSPSHNKPKLFERDRESGRSISRKVNLRTQPQPQTKLSSRRSEMTFKHQCPKCLKSFCSPSKLKRHFLIHTGLKPYSCKKCGKEFRQKVHLKSHINTTNKCSLSAGTASKKTRFCYGGQTSGLQPQPSRRERPNSHHTPVNSPVELQRKISVSAIQDLKKTEIKAGAVVKPEQPFNTRSRCLSFCRKSDEQEQQYLTHEDLKPFKCMICNRSFRLEVNLKRHHQIHRTQNHLGSRSPNAMQNSHNVKRPVSGALKQLPESGHADPIDSNIVVTPPATWSENCIEYNNNHNNSLPLDSESITSAEEWKETFHGTKKQRRINNTPQCNACLKGFPSVSKLRRHLMTHTGQRPFGCATCGKRFSQKTHLRFHSCTHLWSRYHKRRSQFINRQPSRIADFNTKTAANGPVQKMLMYKKDFEMHTGRDVVSVKHLDQTTAPISRDDNLTSDSKLAPHTSKKQEVVNWGMVPKVILRRIETVQSRRNTGKVQHRCLWCSKSFPNASKLQRHEMVHTGLKPFECLKCGKRFSQAPHLKIHERTHCKGKPSKPVSQHMNTRKVNDQQQQQPCPKIRVQIPPQTKSLNTETKLSNIDVAVSNGVSELLSARSDISIKKVKSLDKTKSKSKVPSKKRKVHTCQICTKSFFTPYKLSRHLVTHSGIRPYKCTLCSKAYTQLGHLKYHEQRCRKSNRISYNIRGGIINSNHLQDKHIENCSDFTDLNVDATRESHHTSVGIYSFTDRDLSYYPEAIKTEWEAVPEVDSKLDEHESKRKQTENCNDANGHIPSELAFDMEAPPQSHQYEGNTHNAEVPHKPEEVPAFSDNNKLLSDENVVENPLQPDNYWCEPLTVFDCDTCSKGFENEYDLERHICSTNVQATMTESAQKNRCDICFKLFVTPSKLKRHYVIHTGQRPFDCDICGKTFTQSAHERKHRRTH